MSCKASELITCYGRLENHRSRYAESQITPFIRSCSPLVQRVVADLYDTCNSKSCESLVSDAIMISMSQQDSIRHKHSCPTINLEAKVHAFGLCHRYRCPLPKLSDYKTACLEYSTQLHLDTAVESCHVRGIGISYLNICSTP